MHRIKAIGTICAINFTRGQFLGIIAAFVALASDSSPLEYFSNNTPGR